MIIGVPLLIIFLVSLPWAWVDLYPSAPFAVRPAILCAFPLMFYSIFNYGLNYKLGSNKYIIFFIVTFLAWFLPSTLYDYPHWSIFKIVTVPVYLLISYYTAIAYINMSLGKKWKHYWPLIGLCFLFSCFLSYYYAFGTLVPNMNSQSSSDAIGNLNAGLFDPTVRGGKGIRHTMAIVPVLLLAMSLHNKKIFPMLNVLFIIFSIYLVFYTFSRSAWLAASLVVLLYSKVIILFAKRNILKLYIIFALGITILTVLILKYPNEATWFLNIFNDRISDDRSTDGRISVIWSVISNTSFEEYLFGMNSSWQYQPHNIMLDSLLQSGVFGMFCSIIIILFIMKIYFKGLIKTSGLYIVASAFVAPALVRLFTAGSGLLHVSELFGLCVAANLVIINMRAQRKYTEHLK